MLRSTSYFVLAIVGLCVTWYYNIQYFAQGGPDAFSMYLQSALVNLVTTSITVDVYVSAFVFSIWILRESSGGNTRRHIIEGCEASLRRLKTDYLDVYYIHRPSTQVPIDETLRAVDDLVRAGKVRYIGTSSFAACQILESLWVSKEYGLNRFVVEQTPYHLLDRQIERELLPMAGSYGVGITVWSPLVGGMLTGKYRRDGQNPAGVRLSTQATDDWTKRHFKAAAFDVVETLQVIAQEHGVEAVQIALAWILVNPTVSSVVLGARTVGQLEAQLKGLEVKLTADDLARLDQVIPAGRAITPYYFYLDDQFSDFKPNLHRW